MSDKPGQGAHGAPRAPRAHGPGLGAYFAVFAALMVLTALTVWAAYLHLGVWNTPVALTIAVAKALLVALVLMHLKSAPRLTMLVVAGSLLWLAFLIVITVSDYVTRPWLPIYGS